MNEEVEQYEKREESSSPHDDSPHSSNNDIQILGENPLRGGMTP